MRRATGRVAVAAATALLMAGALAGLRAVDARAVPGVACRPVLYPRVGSYTRMAVRRGGPGLLLDGGGTDVDAAWQWVHRKLVGSATQRGGNVVVLTADFDDAYSPWIVRVAPFASAQTIAIPPCATRAQIDALAPRVAAADFVFFSGGDQAHYAAWKGSRLIAAVRAVYARGGFVGGTSAGLAIQGEVAFDSVSADRLLPANADLDTRMAVRDPLGPDISFTKGLFAWPVLHATITDTHFVRRNRFGRLMAFMGDALDSGLIRGSHVYGLGIDERSALGVDRNGVATLFEQPAAGGYATQGAYLLSGGRAAHLRRGAPLRYRVTVAHLKTPGERFDLLRKTGPASRYTVSVDGARWPPYDRDPYHAR